MRHLLRSIVPTGMAVAIGLAVAGCTGSSASSASNTRSTNKGTSRSGDEGQGSGSHGATPTPIPLTTPGVPGLVVGHRGNRAGAPEDTLQSEISAYKVGAQVLEFDLHMTSDNVPIVMHDDTVDRTTDGTGKISDLTLNQIQKLDAGTSYSPAFSHVGVPTFEQILAFAKGTDAIILPELKEDTWTAHQVDIVADLIRKYDMADRTEFQSFHPDILKIAHEEAPDIARAGLVDDIPSDPVASIRAYDGQGLLPEYTAVTKELVTTLHDAGLSIMVWTVDDPDEWLKLTQDGVDGIMSDNPGQLAGWVARYQQEMDLN